MRVLLASSRRAGTLVPAAGADGGHKLACSSKSDLCAFMNRTVTSSVIFLMRGGNANAIAPSARPLLRAVPASRRHGAARGAPRNALSG
jgi:hypothetical protein